MKTNRCVAGNWVAPIVLLFAVSSATAVTPEQIEADWLRQDELRGSAQPTVPQRSGKATAEQDAAGGVDGVINGNWGFHTQDEKEPWWQVDLGAATRVDRVTLYNRCDRYAIRNNRIRVLLSDDGKEFRQAYQHDGTTFYGHSDKKPLTISLERKPARYLRLQLPGTSILHLDEVQVFSAGGKENVALGKPATQSSTSAWSARHDVVVRPQAPTYPIALAIEQGRKLAENLRAIGGDVDQHAAVLERVARHLSTLSKDTAEQQQRDLYFQVRWAVRRMALNNPLLDFDKILFVKRAPGAFPHMSDQFYGWWSRPGGGIYLLEGFKSDRPRVRCITESWPQGNFLRPDLSHDGKKVLFAFCKYYPDVQDVRDKVNKGNLPEDAFYQLFEMDLDGGNVRQLTRGKYDDFDGRYLPDGDIVFLSTRKGQHLQCTKDGSAQTHQGDLPDSYVRCGGGNHRPVPIFTLHAIDANGDNLRPLSAFENFEWTPAVAHDGRILYARWDYIDRFNGPFMSLWSTNPDGTNPQLVYGNFTKKPQCVFEARPIPGSHKLVFTAAAHHSNMGGALALLDRNRGTEFEPPLTRITPEVCFPETEGWANQYYLNPYPLSEEHFLVAWADRKLPAHAYLAGEGRNPSNACGIYLYDAFGNLTLLHRDPKISSMYPLPVRPRSRPPLRSNHVQWAGPQVGRLLVQDIYAGMGELARGTIKRLRVVAVPPKVQPHMNNPVLGVSREDPGKFILGSVPVEQDGSAWFHVPSGVPVLFQALDADGIAVQTMRSLTYLQPGQTLACIGCHEHRDLAPTARRVPMAVTREPSRLTLGPEGTWPLRYDRLVQPVLDKHCVSCHRPDGKDAKAASFNLTPAKSYHALLAYAGNDLRNLAFEKDQSFVGQCPAAKSKLLALLDAEKGHYDVRLDAESRRRLITWMDTYAQRVGHFSDEQERQLEDLKRQLAPILDD